MDVGTTSVLEIIALRKSIASLEQGYCFHFSLKNLKHITVSHICQCVVVSTLWIRKNILKLQCVRYFLLKH